MAVVTRKSTAIGNRDASPTIPTSGAIAGGLLKSSEGYVTAANGDSIASYFPMVSIPSNARVKSIVLQSEALGGSCAVNCGVYVPSSTNPALLALNAAYLAGAAINATFFASAVSVVAAVASTEIINQSGSNTLDKQEMEIWQALGLASDPGCNLDIGLALSAAAGAPGRIGIKVDTVY